MRPPHSPFSLSLVAEAHISTMNAISPVGTHCKIKVSSNVTVKKAFLNFRYWKDDVKHSSIIVKLVSQVAMQVS